LLQNPGLIFISIAISLAASNAFANPVSLYLVKKEISPYTDSIAISISISFDYSSLLTKLIEDKISYQMIIDTKNSKSPSYIIL
jgi:hypothetical protein